jgi:plasmid stabilization system protein ParE
VKVVFTAEAEGDLQSIGDWIAQDSNVRATSFVRELRLACAALGNMPRAYPLLPHHAERLIRRKPFRSYLIFYWIKRDRVEILHVVHAARDYEKILFPE